MALTVAVTPVHIYMLQQPGLFGMPIWALRLRLTIRVRLLWLIWWSTTDEMLWLCLCASLIDCARL